MKKRLANGLIALVVLVVFPSQISTRKDSSYKTISEGQTSTKIKVDSIQILKGDRDSLLRDNLQSLNRTDRKLDQIPKLVDQFIFSQRRLNNMLVEYIQINQIPVFIPYPPIKTDTTVKKKRTEVNFLGFSNH